MNFKKAAVLAVLGSFALGGSGCEVVRKFQAKEKAPDAQAQGSKELRLRVAPAGGDPEFPDGSQGETSLVSNGEEFVFKKTLRLPRNGGLFLVWSESALDSTIRDAHYSHQVQDSANRTSGAPDRAAASFDPIHRSWFLPLARLIEKRGVSAVSPADLHLIVLDLLLADGSRREFRIYLKLAGPMPALNLRKLDFQPGDAASANHGVVLRQELSNPHPMPLTAWLAADSSLSWKASIASSRWQERRGEPPLGPFWDRRESEVRVEPAELWIRRPGSADERLVLEESGFARLVLEPGEAVEIAWAVRPALDSVRCSLPAPFSREVRWTTRTRSHCRPGRGGEGECFGGDETLHSTRVTEETRVAGAQFSGELSIRLLVSEDWMDAEDLALELHADLDGTQGSVRDEVTSQAVQASSGDYVAAEATYPCQGVF